MADEPAEVAGGPVSSLMAGWKEVGQGYIGHIINRAGFRQKTVDAAHASSGGVAGLGGGRAGGGAQTDTELIMYLQSLFDF